MGGEDWNGLYNERNLCAKDYARPIFAHACLLACLLAVGNNDLFLFSLSDMKAEAKAKAKRDTLFFLSF